MDRIAKLLTLVVGLFALIVMVEACSPRSYISQPTASNAYSSNASRRYESASTAALGTNSGAPSRVPSPEDRLVKKATPERRKTNESTESFDFQKAIDPNQKQQKEEFAQGEAYEQIDPNNAPEESMPLLANSFVGNETEHIKFARYDPFGSNSSFELDLNGLEYCYPINGKFSSSYGRRGRSNHSGVDLVAAALTPIYAVFDGTVRLSKPYSGYGNVIVVRHDNGLETVYAHNTRNLVRVGQKVARGEQIAQCGRTGRASTNHLHFEVRVQGVTINPALLIDVNKKSLQSGVLRIARSSSAGISAKLSKTGAAPEMPILADNTPEVEATVIAAAQRAVVQAKVQPEAEKVVAEAVSPKKEAIKALPPEPVRANASRGMRVGDQLYEVPTNEPAVSTKGAVYHTVASGQTMSGIARKYGTTVSALCKLNKIAQGSADKIRLGQKLRVK